MAAPQVQEVWEQFDDTGEVYLVGALTFLDDWNVINGGEWRKRFVPMLTFNLSISSQLQSHVNENEFDVSFYPSLLIIGKDYKIVAMGLDPSADDLAGAIQAAVVELNGAVRAEPSEITVELPQISQNYPNPFTATTILSFQLPMSDNVKVRVFDATGRLVETLADRVYSPGFHQIEWDTGSTPNGVYLYHLEAGSFSITKRMIKLEQ